MPDHTEVLSLRLHKPSKQSTNKTRFKPPTQRSLKEPNKNLKKTTIFCYKGHLEPPKKYIFLFQSTFFTEVQRRPAPRARPGAAPPAAVGLGVDGPAEAVEAPAAGAGAAAREGAAVTAPAAGAGAGPGAGPAVAGPVVPGRVAVPVAPVAPGAGAAARVGAGVAPAAPGAVAAGAGTGAGAAPAARGAAGAGAAGAAGAAPRRAAGGAAGGAGTAPPGAARGAPRLGRAQAQVVHAIRHGLRVPGALLGALSRRIGLGPAVPGLCPCGAERNSAFTTVTHGQSQA